MSHANPDTRHRRLRHHLSAGMRATRCGCRPSSSVAPRTALPSIPITVAAPGSGSPGVARGQPVPGGALGEAPGGDRLLQPGRVDLDQNSADRRCVRQRAVHTCRHPRQGNRHRQPPRSGSRSGHRAVADAGPRVHERRTQVHRRRTRVHGRATRRVGTRKLAFRDAGLEAGVRTLTGAHWNDSEDHLAIPDVRQRTTTKES